LIWKPKRPRCTRNHSNDIRRGHHLRISGILERDELATTAQRNRIIERIASVSPMACHSAKKAIESMFS
jgi:hypothetical protein